MLDFTPAHAKSYNELVGTVRRNLLLADWNDPNHVESLLNPKQWKLARDTVTNVRKSCCVAGNMMVSVCFFMNLRKVNWLISPGGVEWSVLWGGFAEPQAVEAGAGHRDQRAQELLCCREHDGECLQSFMNLEKVNWLISPRGVE
jgi:hypothetical protein